MILAGLALMGAAVSAQPSAGLERAESLPPDCLAAGAISDAAGAIQRAEEILSALNDKPADGSLRRGLGALIRNPDLAGVDLSAPVRFFYMNPQRFSSPWVYQFGATDADGLKRAMAANRPEAQEGEVTLRLEGRRATWSLDAKAAESVIQWEKRGGRSPGFRAAGQFRARLDVQGLLRAFDSQFEAEVLLMKGRAREALERGGRNGAAVEQEISAVQAQLDSAAAALRQVREADFALELDPAFARVELDVRLVDSSPLRELFRAHAPGDLRLLGLCPPEASLVAVNNVSFVKAAGQMLLNMAGWLSLEKSEPAAGAGHRAVALFLLQRAGEPDAPTRVEILDLRDGDQAVKARQEWDRLARQASEPAMPGGAEGAPFSLHPVSAGGAGSAGVRLAEITPDEATLQPKALAMFRRFLGSRVQAAQECRGDTCVTAIGGSPAERVRQAEALMEAKGGSLAASPCFQRSVASLPEKPNLLLYISPDALRRWFALGGRASSAPIPAGAMGPAAALAMGGDGARFVLKFPTADIPRGR
jgi:hypothetical protein